MRVIIADDEPIIRMDLREILEKQGYEVVAEAADGFDAVECCKKEHPDLVILDVKMPLLDGITAAKIVAHLTSMVKAMIMAPNTIKGERRNKRSTRFTPVCT